MKYLIIISVILFIIIGIILHSSPVQPAEHRPGEEWNRCEDPVKAPLVHMKYFIYCPELDQVWYENWQRWDRPGRLHRQRITEYGLFLDNP